MNTKNNEKKLIAVVGATGNQGGAVVRALSRDPSKHRELADEVLEAVALARNGDGVGSG